VTARPLWIFLHIPKCGGTTFKAHIERHLAIEESFFEFSNWGRQYRADRGLPDFAHRSEMQRASAEVLAGHQLSYGIHRLVPGLRDARYFTVLRDPAERCVSLYNFRWSRGQATDDFSEWYHTWYRVNQSDYQTRFLAERLYSMDLPASSQQRLAMAQSLLELCWFVTTTERWNEGLDHIFSAMGLPADWQHFRKAGDAIKLPFSHPAQAEVVTRRYSATDLDRSMILADSPMDVALVNWVRTHRLKWASG
jgi:hypothetical protein